MSRRHESGARRVLALYYTHRFALPAGLTFVKTSGAILCTCGRLNVDFGMFQAFPIREKMGFQFLMEMFTCVNLLSIDAVSVPQVITSPAELTRYGFPRPLARHNLRFQLLHLTRRASAAHHAVWFAFFVLNSLFSPQGRRHFFFCVALGF